MSTCIANVGITSFNRLASTRTCLESLLDNTRMQICLTVVDNDSTDGSRDYLLNLHERGIINQLFLCEKNAGVAIASNLAWGAVDAPYYIKLDNDVEILRNDWLETLINIAESNAKAGTVGYYIENSRPESSAKAPSFVVDRCVGSCILIPKRTHDVLGFWSEDYGIYGIEDSDFSTRVTLAGLQNHYVSFSENVIRHTHELYSGDHDYDNDIRRVRGLTDEYTAKFYFNSSMYMAGIRPLYVQRKFIPRMVDGLYVFQPDPEYAAQERLYKKEQYQFIAEYCAAVENEKKAGTGG